MQTESRPELVAAARRAMEIEAEAIRAAASRLDERLEKAAELILSHPGQKVIVTGIGKSGWIGRKLAATLQSTGTPAVFLHPAEAAHGDLGICQHGDPVILLSKSGTTEELVRLVHPLRELGMPLIGILGNLKSPLARAMDTVLDASVQKEADLEGFAPTASAAVALAVGHALAVALMEARGFTADDFAKLHAGGQLGRNLRLHVEDVMHTGAEVAWVDAGDSLKSVVVAMSQCPLGAACVVTPERALAGIITDGDVRRAFQAHDDIRELCARDVMTKNPVTVNPRALLQDALCLMENRASQISVLPVVSSEGVCGGLLRIHDVYQTGTRQD